MKNVLFKILPQIFSVTGAFFITLLAVSCSSRAAENTFKSVAPYLLLGLLLQTTIALLLIRYKLPTGRMPLSAKQSAFVHAVINFGILYFLMGGNGGKLFSSIEMLILALSFVTTFLVTLLAYKQYTSFKYILLSILLTIVVPATIIAYLVLKPSETMLLWIQSDYDCKIDPVTGIVNDCELKEGYQPFVPTCSI